ncbi:MAG TPA: DUF3817 domain-containing protein [Fluviicola sp.]|nr:DUF3817 domain-containing protein [Fluviicola sp.]
MVELFKTKFARLKVIAFLEGISFIILMFVALPLKYIWKEPWLVSNIGMVHGALFVLYLLSIIQSKIELRWANGKTALAMLLSIIPFGTFYVVGKMIPKIDNEAKTKS